MGKTLKQSRPLLAKADVEGSMDDFAKFQAEEHMKLLTPLIRAAEYAHVGCEQHQEEQEGYLCGAMAIFIQYHVYGGVCANIDCPEDEAEEKWRRGPGTVGQERLHQVRFGLQSQRTRLKKKRESTTHKFDI